MTKYDSRLVKIRKIKPILGKILDKIKVQPYYLILIIDLINSWCKKIGKYARR